MLRSLVECLAAVALLAFALIAGLGWADRAMGEPAISRPSPYLFEGSTVIRVDCIDKKNGRSWGTAFYLGSGLFMTAEHVLANSICEIRGKPLEIMVSSERPDYAIVRAAFYPSFKVNPSCARLREGQSYVATGYASTDPDDISQTIVIATGISDRLDHDAEINGSLVDGMSGGPVFDLNGAVHAINIWRQDEGAPISGVVELADTVLCKTD